MKHVHVSSCFHVASCVDRRWPVLTACSPRVPYFSAQHLRLPDQTTEHITKINENRWGKMRKDESYGKLWKKLWKVLESLRRVKHDWAPKQRDNVRTTWGQREDPGSGAGLLGGHGLLELLELLQPTFGISQIFSVHGLTFFRIFAHIFRSRFFRIRIRSDMVWHVLTWYDILTFWSSLVLTKDVADGAVRQPLSVWTIWTRCSPISWSTCFEMSTCRVDMTWTSWATRFWEREKRSWRNAESLHPTRPKKNESNT